jgi:hypothetical protein
MKRKPSRRKEKPQPKVKEPFITDKTRKATQNDSSFFQPKLKIGNSNDQAEKEADKAADRVVNQQNRSRFDGFSSEKSVQKQAEKEEPKAKLIQKQAEEEEPKAKLIQKQAEEEEPKAKLIQKQAEEEEPKAKLIQKQEEKEKPEAKLIQKQAEEEEPKAKMIQKQEEKEKPEAKLIQKKAEEEEPKAKLIQKQDKPEDEVQKKASSANQSNKGQKKNAEGKTSATYTLNDMIKKTKGKGRQLPEDIRGELEAKLQANFGKVRIHTEEDAIKMAAKLKAQAFTHGYDIYFNIGKYNPHSKEGKHLLAHELSHVVQQKGHGK